MQDDQDYPALNEFHQLEKTLYREEPSPNAFLTGVNDLFDSLGFTEEYVDQRIEAYKETSKDQIEKQNGLVSKVIKDIVWGMIDLDPVSTEILDCPIVQRLRYIRQNGLTYLVYPTASHTRIEHTIGVFAVASRYIASINKSADHNTSDLKRINISPSLALDIKHAALLHDIGHLPFSHVLETIFESSPNEFRLATLPVTDFEIAFMQRLPNVKSRLSEKLSVAIILAPRFRRFYSNLRKDDAAHLRLACLVSGMPLDPNAPGYSQLISGAVDCDKIDYLLRDSAMCNVPVAIDQARLFLNSAIVECDKSTIQKLTERAVLDRNSVDLDKKAQILVLNSSGVDTIEEVAFARATLYERVYRHAVTRSAERILAVAVFDTAEEKDDKDMYDVFSTFKRTDDTFLDYLESSKSINARRLSKNIRHRTLPKRLFAFSPDFYTPVVPYVSIFSGLAETEAKSVYFNETTSKDPFHYVVQSLKERSAIFTSSQKHRALEAKLLERARHILMTLRGIGAEVPSGNIDELFFIPLPDHSPSTLSCALMTREGEIESSADHSRAPQLLSAKEIGRSVGFVVGDPKWGEIVFLAAQEILYDFFGSDVVPMDLAIEYPSLSETEAADPPSNIQVKAIRRFFIAEELATRRCRLKRKVLRSYRSLLSKNAYYDKRPRLAEPQIKSATIVALAKKFRQFSGQHGWSVTERTILQFLNQFPPSLRNEAIVLLENIRFLDRKKISGLLKAAIDATIQRILKSTEPGATIFVVPLAGTSAHMTLELLKQEFRDDLKKQRLHIVHSFHEALGEAKKGDSIVFTDDNIASGTQFSAQLLQWMGLLDTTKKESIRNERGIEFVVLSSNQKKLMKELNIWLATCVGAAGSEERVLENLQDSEINMKGVSFGDLIDGSGVPSKTWRPSRALLSFLQSIGKNCLRHCNPSKPEAECERDACGYGGLAGLTVTLWNAPTSTYVALWLPGIADGEPWFPLFIRRGYVEDLVIA